MHAARSLDYSDNGTWHWPMGIDRRMASSAACGGAMQSCKAQHSLYDLYADLQVCRLGLAKQVMQGNLKARDSRLLSWSWQHSGLSESGYDALASQQV